jgi:hypothetical protein
MDYTIDKSHMLIGRTRCENFVQAFVDLIQEE